MNYISSSEIPEIATTSKRCKFTVDTLPPLPPTLIKKQNTVVMSEDLSGFIQIRDFYLSKVETTLAQNTKIEQFTFSHPCSTHSRDEIRGIN